MKVQVKKAGVGLDTKDRITPGRGLERMDTIANSFARFAKFQATGRAKRLGGDRQTISQGIQDEVTKKLVSKSYREAIEQKKLRVASLTNLEDVQFGEDKSMRFQATVVTAPEFKLPNYKNIPVELPDTRVAEAEIDATLERLREQTADFIDVPERAAEKGDFVVIDFEGTVEGNDQRSRAQASKNLHGGKKFWLHLAADNFLPKFCEQIVGQNGRRRGR